MDPTPNASGWSYAARVYNEVERLTIPIAQNLITLVHRLRSLDHPDTTVLDNGCGTGALTVTIKSMHPNSSIYACDASSDMVSLLANKVSHADWHGVSTQTLDARKLTGIDDNAFSHTLSTFMICLAPDPDKIAAEMYRVTRPGGVIGMGVWADPYFGFFNSPWTKACKKLEPNFEPVEIMGREWTYPENVKAGLITAGFQDVEVREEQGIWKWESVGELSRYFFDGGNPGNATMIKTMEKQGGDVQEARRLFEGVVVEEYGVAGGTLEGPVMACLATGRK